MASVARKWTSFTTKASMAMPACITGTKHWPTSSHVWPGFHWLTSRAKSGSMVSPSMSSRVSSRLPPGNRSTSSSTRLFRPLDMVDTGFSVPAAKLSRLVDPPAGGWVEPPDSVMANVTRPTRLFSGGGGLASTAADYLRFCQMLLNGGELEGGRIPKPRAGPANTHDRAAVGLPFARLPRRPGGAAGRLDLGARPLDPQRC